MDVSGVLQRAPANAAVDVIAVTSGKGGVGKTNVAVNLAVSLARQGREVVLFDADLGLASVDIALGLRPRFDIRHVLSGEKTLEDILLSGPEGIRVVPAASGVSSLVDLSLGERVGLVNAFSELSVPVDTLIVDTGAGIDSSVLTFASACDVIIVVICDEPTSVTDAYALMKLLHTERGVKEFQLLANMVEHPDQGRQLYAKLHRVTERFLDVRLGYLGAVPRDGYLRRAVQRQGAVVQLYPRSHAARALVQVAGSIDFNTAGSRASRGLGFFIERLAETGSPLAEVEVC
jgi:flagellar biosynthesis protein FlhG